MNHMTSHLANRLKTCLQRMIGARARYQDETYQVIEVLEDGPAIVLQQLGDHTTIQADQHGDAHRRVARTLTLHLAVSSEGELDLSGLGLDLLDVEFDRDDPVLID